jgi:hypothetical protein
MSKKSNGQAADGSNVKYEFDAMKIVHITFEVDEEPVEG